MLRPQEPCERNQKQKKGPRAEKVQKVRRNERVIDIHKKRVVLKNNQDAEAKATRAEELNNLKNMLLDNLEPKDGKNRK